MSDAYQQNNDLILQLLKEKSVVKQDVYSNTLKKFNELKKFLEEISDDIQHKIKDVDHRIKINFTDITA